MDYGKETDSLDKGSNTWKPKIGMHRIGKKLLVIFNDGANITRKEGICSAYSEFEIELDHREIIPMSRVVRVEVKAREN